MVGFRKKSQDSSSFSRSSGARADGRAGAASAGAPQRTRAGRNEPTVRTGKGRRSTAAGRRGYTTSEQMDSRCLTLAESASGVLGRSLDQALARLPEGPGAPAASRDLPPADLPGVRLLVDGRAITSPEAWSGTPRITICGGTNPTC